LGDNIGSISAIIFLLNYYSKIYFVCKDKHKQNCENIFYNLNVEIINFDSNNEYNECYKIIEPYYKNLNVDIFICGAHKSYLKSKITNQSFLNYKQNDEDYKIESDYDFIRQHYWDANLDLKIYYEYFKINSCDKSLELYNSIKKYNICFTHTSASDCTINISKYTNEYLFDNKYIIICANENVYDISSDKYQIANQFVNISISYYIDIITNANNIFIVNSCFSTIIYPLLKTNKLYSKNVNIFDRNTLKKILF
jgi:hypothetical protein